MHVLICGGGVIGAATVFLGCRGVTTVIERTSRGASGKAGGFLASTGATALKRSRAPLCLASLRADRQRLGYRRLSTYGGARRRDRGRQAAPAAHSSWLSDGVAVGGAGHAGTAAQVHPACFPRR
jgi:hypothetical protein